MLLINLSTTKTNILLVGLHGTSPIHNLLLAFLYHGDAELIIVFSVMAYLADDLVAGRFYKTIHQVNESVIADKVNMAKTCILLNENII